MRVRVEDFEEQGDVTLVSGTDENGEPVSFHVPAADAISMMTQMAVGNLVEAVLPDEPGPLKKIGEITDHRRVN